MRLMEQEIQELIERLLKRHADDGTVGGISDVVLRGQVVRLPPSRRSALSLTNVGYFLPQGREYVISDE